MDDELQEFLAWIAEERKGTKRSGVRYPSHRQEWAAEYARRRMAAGASYRGVLKELTVSEPALRKWMGTKHAEEKEPSRLRAVVIKEELAQKSREESATTARKAQSLTVVTPRGLRVEGLDAASVIALLRELG